MCTGGAGSLEQLQEAQRLRHPGHLPRPTQVYSSLPRMQQGGFHEMKTNWMVEEPAHFLIPRQRFF